MTRPDPDSRKTSTFWRAAIALAALVALGASTLLISPVGAQGFQWPWNNETKPAPRPRRQAPPPHIREDPGGGWTARSQICIQLEQRLVQDTQRGSQSREVLPRIDEELRQLNKALRQRERDLERKDCYEYFLFSKSVRRTRRCIRLSNDAENSRRRISDLKAERRDITSSNSRSHQDEIIRELARNNCGASYAQEARRRNRGPFSGFWQDDDGGSGYANDFGALPFATYRTLCVRLCDGYYFPVSFSTLPNHFERDAEVCQSKCAAPSELYFHRNPGGSVDEMVAFGSNAPYNDLKTAFSYRKEYTNGCSCKQAEFVPQTPIPGEPGQSGWAPGPAAPAAQPPKPKPQAESGDGNAVRDHLRR